MTGTRCVQCLWLRQYSGNCNLTGEPAIIDIDKPCYAFTPINNIEKVAE